VGGVSGRPAREADRSDPVRARGRGGGKHPVFGKASSFAGGRWNVGLGRSGTCVEVSSSAGGRTGDSGCSSGAEEGNVVSSPPAKREHPTRGSRKRPPAFSGTRPSLGPKACARQSWLNAAAGQLAGGQADDVSSRSGKPGQPGGTGTEDMSSRTERSSPRIDALAREAARCAEEKEGGRGHRPCEETRVAVEVPVRRCSCRSR
jgi:hypothetical protein